MISFVLSDTSYMMLSASETRKKMALRQVRASQVQSSAGGKGLAEQGKSCQTPVSALVCTIGHQTDSLPDRVPMMSIMSYG